MSDALVQTEEEYFRTRAIQELERAQESGHPAAVQAHYALATRYLSRASVDQPLLK